MISGEIRINSFKFAINIRSEICRQLLNGSFRKKTFVQRNFLTYSCTSPSAIKFSCINIFVTPICSQCTLSLTPENIRTPYDFLMFSGGAGGGGGVEKCALGTNGLISPIISS